MEVGQRSPLGRYPTLGSQVSYFVVYAGKKKQLVFIHFFLSYLTGRISDSHSMMRPLTQLDHNYSGVSGVHAYIPFTTVVAEVFANTFGPCYVGLN